MILKHTIITLIGMPGVGKTTFGKKLAKEYNYRFLDTDELFTKKYKLSIHEFINTFSEQEFIKCEEKLILSLDIKSKTIISTGGSIIYSPKSMSFLQNISCITYLEDTIDNIETRINNFSSRGIIGTQSDSLQNLYTKRTPLYNKYASIKISLPKTFCLESAYKIIREQLS